MDWMPIETAPISAFDKENWFRSGPRFLLFANVVTIGSYSYTECGKGRWRNHMGTIAEASVSIAVRHRTLAPIEKARISLSVERLD